MYPLVYVGHEGGVLRQLAEPLVGRTDELGAFDGLLDALDRGIPAAIEVVGEPGIGKTHLLAELARRADARGCLVLSGCAAELERELPFWIFIDALDDFVAGLDPAHLDGLGDEVHAELAVVLPSLSGRAPEQQVTPHDERHRSHRALRGLLQRLASATPVVLVLDDLHWADPASVDLLDALLRRPPAAGVLVALAARPRQVSGRLSAALERACRMGDLTRFELGVLTPDQARELLGDAVDRTRADRLYEESGGNPFYLQQLARALDRSSGGARPAGASRAGMEVPTSVAAALTEELGLLPPAARLVLEGAAVAGDPFEAELAAAAALTSEEATASALDELMRRDLIRHTDVPRRFRFRHPLVRRAVYEEAGGGWRLRAHERSARALAARGASAVACAHHVEHSARHGDAEAVATLRAAGEAAALRAPASAAHWFAGALRLMPESAPVEGRIELLLARAGALAATGQFVDAYAALLESIDLVPRESLALRVRLTTACAGVEHLMGRHEQAHLRLATALESLPHGDTPEAVALMIELAVDGFYRMEYESMREWAGRALRAARPLGEQPLTAAAAATLAQAKALTGAVAEAERYRSEAATLVDTLPDDELALRLDAVINLAAAEIDLDRFAEAEAHTERAMAVARATGQSDFVPIVILCLGWIKRMRGQLTECCELLDDAAESARLSGNAQSLAGNLLNRSLTALAAGDVETALATAEESVDLMGPLDRSLLSASTGFALAAALLEAGDAARAVDVLVGAGGSDELPLVPRAWRANWLELLTRCWLALGHPGEAARAAEGAKAAAAGGRPMARSLADRAAAAVALDSGDTASAARLALASAVAAEQVGVPVDAALSRTLAGRALARAGQTGLAVTELERAAAQLHACDAVRYRDQVESELRQLGRRVHRRTRPGKSGGPGLTSLTGRELQVARLVVDRRTNPEIAAALFLSQKTVESHIRNMFRKLDVSSRTEIARAVQQAERPQRSA